MILRRKEIHRYRPLGLPMLTILNRLFHQKTISGLDYYLAKLMGEKLLKFNPHVSLEQYHLTLFLVAALSDAQAKGHSCLEINSNLFLFPFGLHAQSSEEELLLKLREALPSDPLVAMNSLLENNPIFTTTKESIAPCFFTGTSLYFYRVWLEEQAVANHIIQRMALPVSIDVENINKVLTQLFPTSDYGIDWQKIAVAIALRHLFCVISGGPGTGKTYTVARLLVALQQLAPQGQHYRINLLAPTGKAAMRLAESVTNALNQLSLDERIKQHIPTQATTLHRFIGIRPYSNTCRHHPQNPHITDILIVDEASMIDLSLMNKLFNAVLPTTRIILLGDKDQLSSVESGAVMGQLSLFLTDQYSSMQTEYLQQTCQVQLESKSQGILISDHLCHLVHSRRFTASSGIGQLATWINQGNFYKIKQQIHQLSGITFHLYRQNNTAHAIEPIIKLACQEYSAYLNLLDQFPLDIQKIFETFNRIRVLSALKVGEFGAEDLSIKIAERIKQQHKVSFMHWRDWYLGKPIMITQNDEQNTLYNGDIGLVLYDKNKRLKVFFEQETGLYRSLLPSRILYYQHAYVMTVHKSQGSEFEHVIFVLPEKPNPILSRELAYTAVTRAKKSLTLFSSEPSWRTTIYTPTLRQSGLATKLGKASEQLEAHFIK